jgi:hypothetical protein
MANYKRPLNEHLRPVVVIQAMMLAREAGGQAGGSTTCKCCEKLELLICSEI